MLLKQFPLDIIRDIHLIRFLFPVYALTVLIIYPSDNFLIYLRHILFHTLQHIKRIAETKLSHIICIRIMVNHHLEFIRSHDSIKSIAGMIRIIITARCKHTTNFDQHLKSVFLRKRSVLCHFLINPDSVSNCCRSLQLKACMLPEITALTTADRSDRIECSLAIQCLITRSGFI